MDNESPILTYNYGIASPTSQGGITTQNTKTTT